VTFTLACVMVRGKRPAKPRRTRQGKHIAKRPRYTGKWVDRLRAMVARHTDRPFRTVCLTDQPEALPKGVEPVVIPNRGDVRGWWAKMNLFDPEMPFDERVLYLDLDVLVLGDLAPIIDYPADFALCADSAPDWQGRGDRRTIKGYNSSCMVWDHLARARFYRDFDAGMPDRLWGDQDALKQMSPNEATFPEEWVVRVRPHSHPFDPAVKLGLCVKWKNNKLLKETDWFGQYWSGRGVQQ
jgi:hypothetical protein